MKNHHRSAEEWRSIVSRQEEQNQTDTQYAKAQGVGVASLRAWRHKFKNEEAGDGSAIVEVRPLFADSSLRVILPNGIKVEITPACSLDRLGRVVGLLRSL
jgi:hypothetical protein